MTIPVHIRGVFLRRDVTRDKNGPVRRRPSHDRQAQASRAATPQNANPKRDSALTILTPPLTTITMPAFVAPRSMS